MNLVQYSQSDNSSPFDSIRHYDEHGNEFWLARELMELLGYGKWQNFHKNIKRAYTACQNAQNDATMHFLLTSVKTNGRSADDWKLTRYACYLIAMNGDPDKPEIAQAQSYFASKAREAEVAIPQLNEQLLLAQLEIEKLKLQNENLHLKTNYMERRNAIQEMHGVQMLALIDGNVEVIEVKEKVTETVICKDGRNVSFVGKSTAEVAKELKMKSGKELELWLAQNKAEHLICQGMRAIQAPYIPEENIKEVKRLFAQRRKHTQRQLLIGE